MSVADRDGRRRRDGRRAGRQGRRAKPAAEKTQEQEEPFPLVESLFILVLAGFVGFEVIGRVSPLLHTPLMAATNAISGISLVGSLVIAGSAAEFPGTVARVVGLRGRHRRHDQRRGRVHDYRPDAADVQEEGTRPLMKDLSLADRLPGVLGAVHPRAEGAQLAGLGAAGHVSMPKSAWSMAVVGTLLGHHIITWEWIIVGSHHRLGRRRRRWPSSCP